MYSIGEFAKLINKSVKTLQRWDREGRLIAKRTASNRRYYTHEQLLQYKGLLPTDNSKIIAYCRVNSANQKEDIRNQKEYINLFCLHRGISIDEWYEDIGSGLNFRRKNFIKLLNEVETGQIKKIIIAHPDRFVRFGFEWFREFCLNHGCEILVINDEKLSPEQEMIQDLITIIHVFSCRFYGLRKYIKRIKNDFNKKDKD